MSYLLISEEELEDTVKLLDNDKYLYKFLFDSSNKDDYHEGKLGITKLRDSLIFSDQTVAMRTLKSKKIGSEIQEYVKSIVTNLFESGNYIGLINDSYIYDNIVFVLSRTTDDTDKALYLSNEALSCIKKEFVENMMMREGLRLYTYDLFSSGMTINETADREYFKIVQKKLSNNEDVKLNEDMLLQFNEMYKYKVLSIYSRLKYFDAREIMDSLNELGFLDERFDNCIINEEKARQLLAKRLTVISLKKDIDILISKGLFKKDTIKYKI